MYKYTLPQKEGLKFCLPFLDRDLIEYSFMTSIENYFSEGNRKKTIIKVDKKYFRPNEVDYLRGSAKKAYKKLNFRPKYSFLKLVKDMVNEDLLLAQEELNKKQ